MQDTTLVCPNCRQSIALTETFLAPLLEADRQRHLKALAQKDKEIEARDRALREEKAFLEAERKSFDELVTVRAEAQRSVIATDEARKAKQLLDLDLRQRDDDLAQLKAVVADRDQRLAAASKAQADLSRKTRELEDKASSLDLTVETRVARELVKIREQATATAEEKLSLTLREKDIQLEGMRNQIDVLQRKAAQGSQQLQGEALELELEHALSAKFPGDLIEPVAKGEYGGDIIQRVVGPSGIIAGTILWESKRTKNWSDSWLPKLRDDQRRASAELAIIVSQAVPKGLSSFDMMDGIWITEPRCAVAVAIALRQSLIALASARQASLGQQTKAELVYRYLTGAGFKHRIEAIVEKFTDMQEGLNRERRAITKAWSEREKQIQGVLEATAGMYGDLQGIAGKSLSEIEGLELPLLGGPD